jgi:GNAT superfamily N-acetyltransferase
MTDIREISAEATFIVRHPVLRAGKPVESCHFEGDELATTKHFGLFVENQVAGVVSIFKNPSAFSDTDEQYQLRGMAILESHQKKGYGEALLQYVENYLKSHKAQTIWFNARLAAIGFYKKLGYSITGKPFEIGDIGIHYTMFKEL